jgi:hypothetical protein
MKSETQDWIETQAKKKTCEEILEDYTPADSGNYDDAYGAGIDDGYIWACRHILKLLAGRSIESDFE